MGLKKAFFVASMSAAALFARAEKNQEVARDLQPQGTYEYMPMGSENEELPSFMKEFQGLDFDGRMELQETIAQQFGNGDFHNAGLLRKFQKENKTMSSLMRKRCMEIANYGCELNSIDPQKDSLASVARKCGFNRLADLMEFHENKENEGKFFLEDQDAKYRSALLVEEDVFKNGGIFDKYGPNSCVEFNRMMDSEFDHHAKRNAGKFFNGFTEGYHTILEKKVHQKLEAQRRSVNSKRQNG